MVKGFTIIHTFYFNLLILQTIAYNKSGSGIRKHCKFYIPSTIPHHLFLLLIVVNVQSVKVSVKIAKKQGIKYDNL